MHKYKTVTNNKFMQIAERIILSAIYKGRNFVLCVQHKLFKCI